MNKNICLILDACQNIESPNDRMTEQLKTLEIVNILIIKWEYIDEMHLTRVDCDAYSRDQDQDRNRTNAPKC